MRPCYTAPGHYQQSQCKLMMQRLSSVNQQPLSLLKKDDSGEYEGHNSPQTEEPVLQGRVMDNHQRGRQDIITPDHPCISATNRRAITKEDKEKCHSKGWCVHSCVQLSAC